MLKFGRIAQHSEDLCNVWIILNRREPLIIEAKVRDFGGSTGCARFCQAGENRHCVKRRGFGHGRRCRPEGPDAEETVVRPSRLASSVFLAVPGRLFY